MSTSLFSNQRRALFIRVLLATALTAAAVLLAPVTPVTAVTPVTSSMVEIPPVEAMPRSVGTWVTHPSVETDPFAMVAVSLPPETLVEVEVRSIDSDGEWNEWFPLPMAEDEGPDLESQEATSEFERIWTQVAFTGEGMGLQVRTRVVDGGTNLNHDIEAMIIDPFGMDRSMWERTRDQMTAVFDGTEVGTPAGSVVNQPAIVTRAGWGANESIVHGPPSYADSVKRAFVHHTAGPNGYTQAQAAGVVRGIQNYHVVGRGWDDIGYNFLIDRYGTIYEGRGGGINRPVIGAHAQGFNTESTGISMMGTFNDAPPPPAAVNALVDLVAWKAEYHRFPPNRAGLVVSGGSNKHPEGVTVALNNVSGHRDVSFTSCPGGMMYAQLPSVRQRAEARIGQQIVDVNQQTRVIQVAGGRPLSGAVNLSVRLVPDSNYQARLVAPDGQVVGTTSGYGGSVNVSIPVPGSGLDLGSYNWDLTAGNARPVGGVVQFVHPEPTNVQATTWVRASNNGAFDWPFTMSASLWPGSQWQVDVTDPNGQVVAQQNATGNAAHLVWNGPTMVPGTYTARLQADDVPAVQRSFEIHVDVIGRTANSDDPVTASVAMSQFTHGDHQAERVVIARSDVFADALAGGPLVGADGALLLVSGDRLPTAVNAEIRRVLADDGEVFILGGPQAVSTSLEVDVRSIGYPVTRLAGDSRAETAVAVAEAVVDRTGSTTAMIARSGPDNAAPWADALAGSAWGANSGAPVLLSEAGSLNHHTAEAIRDLGITETIVLGGEQVLSPQVEAALPNPRRIAGMNRAETATKVANELILPPGAEHSTFVLANGYHPNAWVYALIAIPWAARNNAPLVLTETNAFPSASAELIRSGKFDNAIVVGTGTMVRTETKYAVSDLLVLN